MRLLFIKTAMFQQTAFIRFHHRHRNENIMCVLLLKLKSFGQKNKIGRTFASAGHNVSLNITIEEEGEIFNFIYSPVIYLFLCYESKGFLGAINMSILNVRLWRKVFSSAAQFRCSRVVVPPKHFDKT